MTTEILFLCLARDCAKTFPLFVNYLKRLNSNGFSCSAIIGENNSKDNTREIILQASGSGIELLDTVFMAGVKSRLARMALGRQALLDISRKRIINTDYIIIADLDNAIKAPPESKHIHLAIERMTKDEHLFAVSAASSPVYYDLLSLRADGFEFLENLNREITVAKHKPLDYYRFHQRWIYNNQKKVTSLIPMRCRSSFNGFCLYRATDYFLGSYRADNEADVCEHVSINLSINRQTGKHILIDENLVLKAPEDHLPVNPVKFWLDRIRKHVSGLLCI
jgi:hypothetical protein